MKLDFSERVNGRMTSGRNDLTILSWVVSLKSFVSSSLLLSLRLFKGAASHGGYSHEYRRFFR